MNDTPTPRTDAQTFDQDGKRPTGAEGEILSVPADLARQLEGEINAWQTELSKVMPPDFKDWWENSKAEWPLVARWVIEGKNRRAEQLERELGSPTDSPDANATAHARVNWWKDRCDDLNEQLAAERALADKLAEALKQSTEGFGDRLPCEENCECAGRRIVKANEQALAAWKEARRE